MEVFTMDGIGYIRVSRVGGRTGDSFISPAEQRKAIEALAQREGIKVTYWLEELDVSGGDSARPKWNQALGMIEHGSAKALLVWNISRFSRSLSDALTALERIEKAGGGLYSAAGDVGDETPTGRFTRNVFLSLAQMERERARDNFLMAVENAVDRGIHMASRIPYGYVRDGQTRRLLIDPKPAAIVKRIFEMRAGGSSWGDCAKYFVANEPTRPLANREAIRTIIKNRAYLGIAFHGEVENRGAHQAIVSQRLFDRANATSGRRPSHTGAISSQTMLQGLVFCHTCNRRMSLGGYRKNGKLTPQYACKHLGCTGKTSIKALDVDAEVVARIFGYIDRLGNAMYRPKRDKQTLTAAQQYLADVEYDREKLVKNRDLRRLMTAKEYNTELASLNALVVEARQAVQEIEEPESEPEVFHEVWDTWTIESKREWLQRFVKQVVIKRANHKKLPVGERMAVQVGAEFNQPFHQPWLLAGGEPFRPRGVPSHEVKMPLG
jgi:DNA invertase Pin-like site-specific DNA recombinase